MNNYNMYTDKKINNFNTNFHNENIVTSFNDLCAVFLQITSIIWLRFCDLKIVGLNQN